MYGLWVFEFEGAVLAWTSNLCVGVFMCVLACQLRRILSFWIFDGAVPVRTVSDKPYRLQKLKLRFFYESDIRQPNLEVSVFIKLSIS